MSTCKDCLHYEVCGGFTPTDLDADVFDYCRKGNTDEIPDIDERCGKFKPKADYVAVVRCKDCKYWERLYYRPFVEPRDDGRCRALWQFHGAERYTTLEDHFCSYGERNESEVKE